MKVTIDREGCIECGACEAACPRVFVLKLGETASIVDKFQTKGPAEGEVGADLESCAKEAETSCPVSVIHTA